MSNKDDRQEMEEKDILDEMQDEIEDIENEEWEIDEEKLEEAKEWSDPEVVKLKDLLARVQADFDNFKKRTDRDREDMIFYLKSDIFKKLLPRIDDLERIIKNTPEDMHKNPLFEWIASVEKSLKKDLEWLWVKPFKSLWLEATPDKHDVMTQAPWKKEWVICDEFEKWYMLWDKVLRHAKVVVWAG